MILKLKTAEFRLEGEKIEAMRLKIERLKARYNKRDDKHRWIKWIAEPLARELCMRLGRKHWEVLGPFGLSCSTSIWLYDTKEDREALKLDSLTFRPDLRNEDNPFGIRVVDYTVNTKQYPDNTLGAVNGMNHPEVVPPADADIQWFCDRISYARDKQEVI